MISKGKVYHFKKETLQYEVVKPSFRVWFSLCSKYILRSTLIAAVLIFITLAFGLSPSKLIRQKRIENFTAKYSLLFSKLDSIQNSLQTNNFESDNLYRQLLELDSIPSSVRQLGTGGHDPFEDYLGSLEKGVLLALTQKIDALKKQIFFQQNSYSNIDKELSLRVQQYNEIPQIAPVKPDKAISLSSYFGSRRDPFTFGRRYHEGLDFSGPINTNIFSTASGTVTLVEYSRRGYGNEIVITHGFGYSTRYAHLNEILVTEGQKVELGQLIGKMGSSGRSTGIHLHYEILLHNYPLDPINFYADNLSPDEYELLTKKD